MFHLGQCKLKPIAGAINKVHPSLHGFGVPCLIDFDKNRMGCSGLSEHSQKSLYIVFFILHHSLLHFALI